MQEIAISISAAAIVATSLGLFFAFRKRSPSTENPRDDSVAAESAEVPDTGEAIPELFAADFYQFAFRRPLDEPDKTDNTILKLFSDQQQMLLDDPTVLPRQPLILPKLLKALKHESSNSSELVKIILQDPGLTADVLKMSNSPLYRNTKESVNDMEYAIVVLGIDGLKSVICASIMRPIFSDNTDKTLTPLLWDYSLSASFIAQRYLNKVEPSTAFNGYLLTLLSCISELVIVQAASRLLKNTNLSLEPKSLTHLTNQFRYRFTLKLMQNWGLEEPLIQSLQSDDKRRQSPVQKAQRIGRGFGRAIQLLDHECMSKDAVISTIENSGIDPELATFLLAPSDRVRTKA